MTAIFSRFYGWALGVLAVLAAVAGVYLRGRSAGKQAEQQKATKQQLEHERARAETIQEVSSVQTEIARLPDADVRQRLQKWTRDN